jgi:dGTPase
MDWTKLLTHHRLGRLDQYPRKAHRPPWQWDVDRITFSSAFRRMQDKTQVFPLSSSDYIRTRLTHSMEVAAVGRAIGNLAGFTLQEKGYLGEIHPLEIGMLLAAATLAHDIGNPPFGHSGENAIRCWFNTADEADAICPQLSPAQRSDFQFYEGNAQGFRVLGRLQMYTDSGGMQLTASTMAAFCKYPVGSEAGGHRGDYKGQSTKKFGYFQAEKALFAEMAAQAGLTPRNGAEGCWIRHPLAFLVEAADDICYRIVDLEDAFRQNLVTISEVEELTECVIRDPEQMDRARKEDDHDKRVDVLRSLAIGAAITAVTETFSGNLPGILDGSFDVDLLSATEIAAHFLAIKNIQAERVYLNDRVLRVEAAGFRVLGGLLKAFTTAIFGKAGDTSIKDTSERQKLFDLVPKQFLGPGRAPDPDCYIRLLKIVDYVCGMTDSYALNLYRHLSGISVA